MPVWSSKVVVSRRVSTTIRIDKMIKARADGFAASHGIDFSTLMHLSLQNTLNNGLILEPQMSPQKLAQYEEMTRWVDVGTVPTQKFDDITALKAHYLG